MRYDASLDAMRYDASLDKAATSLMRVLTKLQPLSCLSNHSHASPITLMSPPQESVCLSVVSLSMSLYVSLYVTERHTGTDSWGRSKRDVAAF